MRTRDHWFLMHAGIDIIGLGCAAVDDVLFVDAYPPADAKSKVVGRERFCGGLTATALVAATRLGSRCAYAGLLGQDELSAFVRRELAREGVDLSLTRVVKGGRPVHATIIVDDIHGTRNIFFDVDDVAEAPPNWPPQDCIPHVRAVFVDHFHLPAQVLLAKRANECGVPVIADLECTDLHLLDDLISLVDHLIVSECFACQFTGKGKPSDAALALWKPGRAAVVVTCGDEGCWWVASSEVSDSSRRPALQYQPAFTVHALDTTGCGDVFHGAYASELLRGHDIATAVRFASAAAALKATRRGGQAGAPIRSEVDLFMERCTCPMKN